MRIFRALILLLSAALVFQPPATAQSSERDVLLYKAQEAAASESWSDVQSYMRQLVALDRAALQTPGLEIGFNPETDALFNSLISLELAHEKAGDINAASAVLAERVEILETLALSRPEDIGLSNQFDNLRRLLAKSYVNSGKLDEAEALYRKSAALSKSRMDALPEAPGPIGHHKQAYEGLLSVNLARRDLETADQMMVYIINLQDQIINGAGLFDREEAEAEKSEYLLNRAAILKALDKNEDALEAIKDARAISDYLIDFPWDNSEALSNYNSTMSLETRLSHYINAYSAIAQFYVELDNVEAATESYANAVVAGSLIYKWVEKDRIPVYSYAQFQLLIKAADFHSKHDQKDIMKDYLIFAFEIGEILLSDSVDDPYLHDQQGRVLAALANTNHPDYSWKRAADFWKSLNDRGLLKPDSQALYDEIQRVAAAEALQPSE